MSLSARNWAWDAHTLTLKGVERPLHPGEKLTLLCIAEMENCEEGVAFPSMEYIAKRTQQSVRTVQTHVHTLEDVGAFEITRHRSRRGRWLRNAYRLDVPSEYRERDPEWLAHQE
jgi:DNA-binding MarR family transcriptional regulator